MRWIAALAAAAVSTGTLSAADILIRDFRLAAGVTPGPSRTTEDYSAGSGSVRASGSNTYKANAAQAVDVYAGFAGGELHDYGLVYGIGLDAARGRFSPRGTGSNGLDYMTLVPQIRAGLGYAFSTSFHIELTPF
nr:hypothetical protein [Planctomycetota bacterium]